MPSLKIWYVLIRDKHYSKHTSYRPARDNVLRKNYVKLLVFVMFEFFEYVWTPKFFTRLHTRLTKKGVWTYFRCPDIIGEYVQE